MRLALAAAALFAAASGAAPAHAQSDAAIVGVIRELYINGAEGEDGSPLPLVLGSAGFNAVSVECAAMQRRIDAERGENSAMGMCSDDYVVLCQCQDDSVTDWTSVDVRVRHPDARHAEAIVTFPPAQGEAPDDDPDLKFVFVGTPQGWQVTDLWEYAMAAEGGEGSFRKRLTASIAEMRRDLGMPAWEGPAAE